MWMHGRGALVVNFGLIFREFSEMTEFSEVIEFSMRI
jgi:hypothetical protein